MVVIATTISFGFTVRLARRPGRFLGADGPFAADQLQYMSWIRESGEHFIVRNLFAGADAGIGYVHPMFAISGLLWRLGLPMTYAFLLWKPVALAVLIVGSWQVIRRSLDGGSARLVALALALFSAPPILAIERVLNGRVPMDIGEASPVMPVATSWGYLPTTLALGLLPLLVLGAAQCWEAGDRPVPRRLLLGTACAGALTSWVHPWEGVVGVVVVASVAGWSSLTTGIGTSRMRRTALIGAATAAPLLYYVALTKTFDAWNASSAYRVQSAPAIGSLILTIGPLLAVASLAWRDDGSFLGRSLRVWPLAAVIAALTLGTTAPPHFLASSSLPLGILAATGISRLRSDDLRRGALSIVALLFTVPGSIVVIEAVDELQSSDEQTFVIDDDEFAALGWIGDQAVGTVLTTPRLSTVVPVVAGQPTWYGHPNWTPDFAARRSIAVAAFDADHTDDAMLQALEASKARYVLTDCETPRFVPPPSLLEIASERVTVGCATVYVIDASERRAS